MILLKKIFKVACIILMLSFIWQVSGLAQEPIVANGNGKAKTRLLAKTLSQANFNLEKYQILIVQLEKQLEAHSFNDYELSYYRKQLTLIAANLKKIADKAKAKVTREQKLLQILEAGALKEKRVDVSKDKFLSDEIKRYKLKIAESQAQLLKIKYFQTRIDNMVIRIQNLRMALRKNLTFQKNQPLYLPSVWLKGGDELKTVASRLTSYQQDLRAGKNDRDASILLIIMLLAYAGYRVAVRRWLNHKSDVVASKTKFSQFNIHYTLRAVVPGMIFYMVGVLLHELIGGYGSLVLLKNVFRCIGFLILAVGLVNISYAIYTEGQGKGRKHVVTKSSLKVMIMLFTVFIFVNNVNILAFHSLTFLQFNPDVIAIFNLLWGVVFFLVVWHLLAKVNAQALQTINHRHFAIRFCINYFAAIRLVILLVLIAYPVLLLLGLINFGTNLVINVAQSAILVAIFDWLHTMVKRYMPQINSSLQEYYHAKVKHDVEDFDLEKAQNKSQLVNYWLVTVFDVILIFGFIIVFILLWGLHYEVLEDWLNVIFVRGIPIGKNATFSLTHLLRAIFMFFIIFWLTRFVQFVLEKRVLSYLRMDYGTKHAVKTTVGYIGLGAAIVMFIYSLGISVTTLTFIISGLSVGIGIGLQDFFKNFFAGLILLIERPVKIGDMVIVNNDYGVIKKIRLRATEIETFNNTTFIVPNSDFVIKPISNETLNPVSRADINIGISYDNDPKMAKEVLLEVAKQHPKVLANPSSDVIFQDFADSFLSLQLRVYLLTSDRGSTTSELRFAILEAFNKAGIEIPYPQNDIHIKEYPALGSADVMEVDPGKPPQPQTS